MAGCWLGAPEPEVPGSRLRFALGNESQPEAAIERL